ncbi:MAG: NAD+ synthase [Cycloclasticus sp. symbiont of Poecilosclerida sp. M]|nr:MAG: NAD+ synthase [Cycloclasticus sp. symbiont of Poecilosclerida sp. M]
MKIAIVQFNPVVGDLEGNGKRMVEFCQQAIEQRAAAIIFPELAISGYPPEDLLLRVDFLSRIEKELKHLAEVDTELTVMVGYSEKDGVSLYNSVAVLRGGEITANYRKQQLPNYGVFDEKRYFNAGTQPCVFELQGVKVGLTICEDIWSKGACEQLKNSGAELIINLNASPFEVNKNDLREKTVNKRVKETGLPIIYLNQVGGQDELVFDGASFVMNGTGEVVQRLPAFEQTLAIVELDVSAGVNIKHQSYAEYLPELDSIYQALVLGIADYVEKNGFQGAVLGLSGGIDSALTLALAVDALGVDCVEAVLMPSKYTADMSNVDAIEQAELMDVLYEIIPIEPAVQAFSGMLEKAFEGYEADVTEENIQARCRGVLLMAISNKKRKILLTTGNKSEMSVGYATLYGDMAGGFAPLKDVPKMMVYALAKYRNEQSRVIPERVIERPPSAELAPDQKDEDSLPQYPILDEILARYIEQDQARDEIIAAGFESTVVDRVLKLVEQNEYKRRQAPPGIKVTSRSFGRERRYPITSGFSRLLKAKK